MAFQLDRYFDYAATTPVDPRVRAEMVPFLGEAFGNPHSLHAWGARARAAVELARERIASVAGGFPQHIFFTGSATEANNWIISSYSEGAISRFEHSAVRVPALSRGFREIDLDFDPRVESLPEVSGLLSVIHVNNETGIVLPWDVDGNHEMHRDASQSLGKWHLPSVDGEFMTLSSHKAYGPKGVGCLVCIDALPRPFLLGGEQEQGIRAGTLNVPAIVGFGLAAALAEELREEDWDRATNLRSIFLSELKRLSHWQVTESKTELFGAPLQVPHILNLNIAGVEGETLVVEADAAGFAISAGAACSSGSTEPSHVLRALGVPEDRIRGTIRISFGRYNTPDSTVALAREIVRSVTRLRRSH